MTQKKFFYTREFFLYYIDSFFIKSDGIGLAVITARLGEVYFGDVIFFAHSVKALFTIPLFFLKYITPIVIPAQFDSSF